MIAIITDSTCDIPAAIAEEAGILIVPAMLHIGDETFEDGVSLSREAFYERLPQMSTPPTTAAPAPGSFLRAYEAALGQAQQVVSIHVSGRLSSIVNSARVAAAQLAPDRIHIVDSGQVSMGLGWAALAAAEAARRSESLQGVLHCVQDTLSRIRFYALLNTVEFLARSGRINMVQAGLASLLSLKPLIELRAGAVSTLARLRTWSRAVISLRERTLALAPIERLAIMHTQYTQGAHEFLDQIYSRLSCPAGVLIVNATTAIGAHVGPHALGIAAVVARPST